MPPSLYDLIMLDITLICVGKLKESFYREACAEYIKRLGAYCRLTVLELAEERKPENPSPAQVEAALYREAEAVKRAVPKGAAVIALCVEGREQSSESFAGTLAGLSQSYSKLALVIGGSDGLHRSVKDAAALRLSMSPMTFPHHLARVMVLEQLYRAYSIMNGGKYHK